MRDYGALYCELDTAVTQAIAILMQLADEQAQKAVKILYDAQQSCGEALILQTYALLEERKEEKERDLNQI